LQFPLLFIIDIEIEPSICHGVKKHEKSQPLCEASPPSGRAFCLAAALRARGARRSFFPWTFWPLK